MGKITPAGGGVGLATNDTNYTKNTGFIMY
jgi:hypothetical protein